MLLEFSTWFRSFECPIHSLTRSLARDLPAERQGDQVEKRAIRRRHFKFLEKVINLRQRVNVAFAE